MLIVLELTVGTDLFNTNGSIVRDLAKAAADSAPDANLLVISNPVCANTSSNTREVDETDGLLGQLYRPNLR
jgi:malate dehydrogenase